MPVSSPQQKFSTQKTTSSRKTRESYEQHLDEPEDQTLEIKDRRKECQENGVEPNCETVGSSFHRTYGYWPAPEQHTERGQRQDTIKSIQSDFLVAPSMHEDSFEGTPSWAM